MEKLKVLVIGTGMMGTSLANALIAKNYHTVTMFEPMGNNSHGKQYIEGTWYEIYCGSDFWKADIVILATPKHVATKFVARKLSVFKRNVIITDIASAKGNLLKEINDLIKEEKKIYKNNNKTFVSSHPMCGSEKKGSAFADFSIFEGRNCIVINPFEWNDAPWEYHCIKGIWEHLGMKISTVQHAHAHDVIVANVSHLPHVVAFAMAQHAGDQKEQSQIDNRYYGNSIKDMTRIAGASPEMWSGVFNDNADNVCSNIDLLIERLHVFRDEIKRGNVDIVKDLIKQANLAKKDIE